MDSYIERRHKGLGTNLKDAIVGVLIGVVMFIASFPVLWWNEGRLDMSKVAKTAVELAPGAVDPAQNNKFASLTAPVTVSGQIGDSAYLVPGPYLSVRRKVEMYAWVEKKTTTEEKNVGGSSDQVTRYDYYKEWVLDDNVKNAGSFKIPAGHENPMPPVRSETKHATQAMIGQYSFVPSEVQLPPGAHVSLNATNVQPGLRVEGDYVFIGLGSVANPVLGDTRISFEALSPPATATMFGFTNGASFTPYVAEDGDKFIRLFPGDRASAIQLMSAEHTLMTWILRGVGFLLMWIGMLLFFGPINSLLDILPFLGSAGRFLVGVATFPIALALSIVTILISIIFHNVWLLVGVMLAIGLLITWRSLKRKPA